MEPIWTSRDEALAEENPSSANPASLPKLISRLLGVRGFKDSSLIERLLYPKLSELKDPFLLDGMTVAVERLARAFVSGERVCIYADFDLDGTSGLALLWTGLRGLGFQNVLRYQPKRLSEGYGLHASAIEELHKQGVTVIVTVDVGITAIAACERARELGIDVILTDHHLPGERLPPALTVVNPNKGAGETSGLGFLCGAGVAFYLLRALKRHFHETPSLPSADLDLKGLLDFFTIATLTDMVPLIEDNRVLVKHGLVVLAETKRPGLRALLDALDLSDRPLTSQDVAIRFAPKLNALSRMEAGVLPIDIMLCESPSEARKLIKGVLENNNTRVQLQAEAEAIAMEKLRDWPHEEFAFVASDAFHRGVVGLIATKVAQNLNRPAFVGSLDPEDGMVVGSARLPAGSEGCLVTALSAADGLLNRYGGHSAAAGFELMNVKAGEFMQALKDHFVALKEKPRPVEMVYDLDVTLDEVGASLMKWYDFVGPFGAGFAVPVFRFSEVQLLHRRDLRGGHVKLTLTSPGGTTWEALLFSPTERQRKILDDGSDSYEILGELQWNYFGGQKTIQILVKDLKVKPKWQ